MRRAVERFEFGARKGIKKVKKCQSPKEKKRSQSGRLMNFPIYGSVAAKSFPLPAQIICATYRPESAADGSPPPATTQWPAM